MDIASIYYLGVTLLLFCLFGVIVVHTLRRERKEQGESPKYRMIDHD